MSNEAYAGDITAEEAWEKLVQDEGTVLVDCRTRPEWLFVGIPDLSSLGKKAVFAEWQVFPSMQVNGDFAQQLRSAGVTEDQQVLFICRSGARSKSAAIAMTTQGFSRCFNVSGGFEGPHDDDKHRGEVDGWKASDLPWIQE